MYTVLIVDDEEPVLESYAYMIRNSGLDIASCPAARTGHEAIAIARETHPDIVVMDIAMPGIDGLDTIRELQKSHPDTLFILSTAYERFDLAQRAIPLRVFEYLVKPVSRKTFLDTLRAASDFLDENRKSLAARLENAESVSELLAREEEEFLLRITWSPLDDRQWERYRRALHFSSDFGRVLAVQPRTHPRDERILAELHDAVREKLMLRFRVLSVVHLGRVLVFVPETADTASLDRYIEEKAVPVLSRIGRAVLGAGDRRRFDEFYLSYEHALARLASSIGTAGIGGGTEPEPDRDREAGGGFFPDLRSAVAHACAMTDAYDACMPHCAAEFDRLPFPAARSRMIALFTLLVEDLAARAGRDRAELVVQRIGEPALVIPGIENRRDWEAWAARALRLIVEENVSRFENRVPILLKKAIAFIETRFGEDIHLAATAEFCGVSPGHLSRAFSDHLDTTFNDFLNHTRIAAAVRLLDEGTLSIKEIAYRTGY